MARRYVQTSSTNEITEWMRIDSIGKAGNVFLIVVDMNSTGEASASIDVEFSVEKDLTDPIPIQHHILNNINESCASSLNVPITGIRMKVLNHTKGTITLRVLQHQG